MSPDSFSTLDRINPKYSAASAALRPQKVAEDGHADDGSRALADSTAFSPMTSPDASMILHLVSQSTRFRIAIQFCQTAGEERRFHPVGPWEAHLKVFPRGQLKQPD